MRLLSSLLRRFCDGRSGFTQIIDNRFRKARPGSVLILVVALLVLLALMGTAYIETTRVDRHSSVQNSFNTEIDLVIDAVCKIEQQMILTAKGAPTDTPTANDDSMIWTSLSDSTFFGNHIPIANASGNPIWPHLKTAPLGAQFESPYVPTGQTGPLQYGTTTNLQPTSITVTTASGSTIYPALLDSTTGKTYLAASASGSGIADSGLWRLPLGELNGVVYYGSAFSIDNGSAVNASIATQPNGANAALPGDFFPTSVDLQGMLHSGSTSSSQQLTALNAYRWGAATASLSPMYDDGTAPAYTFTSSLEAMWMQLGRRLDNPGLNTAGVYYQALPIGESMSMAHRYCLMSAAASPSLLEQYLAPSVTLNGSGAAIRTSPYGADQAQQWFTDNFVYDNGGGNIRPLLVARNQISNISASRFTYRPNPAATTTNSWNAAVAYSFGDWITGTDGRTYVCVQENTNTPPTFGSLASDGYWALEPWMNYPVKTSINTATFDQLWLAYWGVMSASGPEQPDAASAAAMFRNPIRGAVNVSASSSNPASGSGNVITVNPGDDVQSKINSSSPGDTVSFAAGTYNINSTINFLPDRTYNGGGAVSGIAALTPPETLRLRAAIAAMNSQQLRSNNTVILSRQIGLGGAIAGGVPTNSGGATLAWAAGNPHADGPELGVFSGGTTTEFSGFTITGCQLHFEGGAFNVHDNTFVDIWRGIFVGNEHDSHFDNNTFLRVSAEGVYGYPGNNNTYNNNTFDYVLEPIHMVAINDQTQINNNIITHATRIGIELQNGMKHLTVNSNWFSDWLPHLDPNNGIDSHMGISCATGPQGSGAGPYTNYGENITISGNTILQNGPLQAQDTWAKSAIEIMGDLNLNITNNYTWGWGNGIINGASGTGANSSNNVYIGDNEYGGDFATWPIVPVHGSGDRFYHTGDPAAPPWPAQPSAPSSSSSSTTQPSAASLRYRVTLFGTGQQPYITEVYGNNDQTTGGGFIAVAIYNPYNTPLSMKNWQWATVARGSGVTQLLVTALDPGNTDLSALVPTLAAHQRIVFSSKAVADMPTGIQVDPGATFVFLPLLTAALDRELILLRPRDILNGNLGTSAVDPNNVYDETSKISDLVPVDSYDFTGLTAAPDDPTHSAEWHYVRPSDPNTHNWYFVYPYTYDKKTADNASASATTASGAGIPTSRLFATMVTSGATPTPTSLGAAGTAPADTTFAAKGFPIQINNTDFGGPKGAALSQFPFGAFARNGDILQTTYIGAYRIDIITLNADGTVNTAIAPKIVEYNPVAMDAAFADDLDDNDNLAENVGRFCPIHPDDCANEYNDFTSSGTASAYHFAMRLFDFLTVSGPADDYMQNIGAENSATVRQGIANVKAGYVNAYPNPAMPTTEDNAPTDGLININTAPWRVLAALPMAGSAADNATLAKAIVQYRDGNAAAGIAAHGPFKSILELNGVPQFRTTLASTMLGAFNPSRTSGNSSDRGPIDGDLAPFTNPANDQVPGDFEKEFLAFNRISNLVTVRSDSFTTYVLVQGWRNAGTAKPELVVQRRAAFISDRSASIPSNKVLNVTNIPVN